MEFDSIPKQTRVPKPPPFGSFEKHLIDGEIVALKIKVLSRRFLLVQISFFQTYF